MRTNLAIAALLYPMIQAVAFGAAMLMLLALDAPSKAFMPSIAATFAVSAPIALLMAPRLRSRAWRQRHGIRVLA